jgi:PiT family inorganic phosphate transporter
MEQIQTSLWVVTLLFALAFAFDFMNGFHDAVNSIATVVSTGVLKPGQAILFAALMGAVVARAVAGVLIASGIWRTVVFIVVSPLLGFLLGSLMMVAVAWIVR